MVLVAGSRTVPHQPSVVYGHLPNGPRIALNTTQRSERAVHHYPSKFHKWRLPVHPPLVIEETVHRHLADTRAVHPENNIRIACAKLLGHDANIPFMADVGPHAMSFITHVRFHYIVNKTLQLRSSCQSI